GAGRGSVRGRAGAAPGGVQRAGAVGDRRSSRGPGRLSAAGPRDQRTRGLSGPDRALEGRSGLAALGAGAFHEQLEAADGQAPEGGGTPHLQAGRRPQARRARLSVARIAAVAQVIADTTGSLKSVPPSAACRKTMTKARYASLCSHRQRPEPSRPRSQAVTA